MYIVNVILFTRKRRGCGVLYGAGDKREGENVLFKTNARKDECVWCTCVIFGHQNGEVKRKTDPLVLLGRNRRRRSRLISENCGRIRRRIGENCPANDEYGGRRAREHTRKRTETTRRLGRALGEYGTARFVRGRCARDGISLIFRVLFIRTNAIP